MKKIIWIAFAALTALWTGLVVLTLQLTDWVLASIALAQVPGSALDLSQWAVPQWAAGLVAPAWLQLVQGGLVWASQNLNQILPVVSSLGTLISVAGWFFWGVIEVGLFVLALILTRRAQHGLRFANLREGRQSSGHRRSGH